jgi:hypothetical protein
MGMETLLKAASDFLAALLSTLGFVGRPRRRAGIRDDLDLLDRLRSSPDFGPDSAPHRFLTGRVTLEVAKLSGVELSHKKKVPWASVVVASIIGAPLAYWTFVLDQDGFRWLSLLPGVFAALMFIAVLGMLFDRDEPEEAKSESTGGDDASMSEDHPHASSVVTL